MFRWLLARFRAKLAPPERDAEQESLGASRTSREIDERYVELKETELQAKREVAEVHVHAGFPEAARGLEVQAARLGAEVAAGRVRLESRRAREREVFGDDVAFDVMGED